MPEFVGITREFGPFVIRETTDDTSDVLLQIEDKNGNVIDRFLRDDGWEAGGPGGPGGVTDHGNLEGLGDDDHSQYFNTVRGDARYSQLGHAHAAADITSGVLADARIPALDAAKVTTGQFPIGRLASGTPTGSKFVRDDGVLAVPSSSVGTSLGNYYTLASDVAAGATQIVLDRAPSADVGVDRGYFVIDAGSVNAEARRIHSMSGATMTLKGGSSPSTPAALMRYTATSGNPITFTAATKRISANAETISRFFPGARITISGTASNNGAFTVADYPLDGTYDGTYITVNETVVDEAGVWDGVVFTMDLNRAHAAGTLVIWVPDGPHPVTWYGAKPSANTADAANNRLGIQRAIDDAYWQNINDLYFPGFWQGRYFIDKPLFHEKLIHLRGAQDKAPVLTAASTFPTWDDNMGMLVSRRNGLPCRYENGGNDRYYITGLGFDGQNVAYAKSTSYTSTNSPNLVLGTAYVASGGKTVSIHASMHTSGNKMTYRAVAGGTGGNAIRVAHVNNGASLPLDVSVSGNDITVQLATNGSGTITSTVADVVAAVNAHVGASALVVAANAYNKPSTNLATAFAMTTLLAGTEPFSAGDVGRSIYLGMKRGGCIIASYVNAYTVTVSGAAIDELSGGNFPETRTGVRFAISPINGMLYSCNQASIFHDIRMEKFPGYEFAQTGTQEFDVKNLIVSDCGIPIRLYNSILGTFRNVNAEGGLYDTICQFEGVNCRSITFDVGHIEGTHYSMDEFRAVCGTLTGITWIGYWSTIGEYSTNIKIDSNCKPPTYSVMSWMFSGPNSGPTFVDDSSRGYTAAMTDFVTANDYCVALWTVGSGGTGSDNTQGEIVTNRTTRTTTVATNVRIVDKLILANAAGGAFTVTLPNADGLGGNTFSVKRTNGGANAVTVGSAGGTIDGAATRSLDTQYAALTVISDGTNWSILETHGTVT